MKAVVTVTGKDSVGIIAEVATAAACDANIVEISQSVLREYFAMICWWTSRHSMWILRRSLGTGLTALGKARVGWISMPCTRISFRRAPYLNRRRRLMLETKDILETIQMIRQENGYTQL